jgi:hypothetical protein
MFCGRYLEILLYEGSIQMYRGGQARAEHISNENGFAISKLPSGRQTGTYITGTYITGSW